jgi:hypothetical protein
VVGIIVWVLAPLLAVGGITYIASGVQVAGSTPLDWSPIRAVSGQQFETVDLVIKRESGPAVAAPSWVGTVQQIFASPGSNVSDGSRVATVDGVERLAVSAAQPFYRVLVAGDSGPDVATLNAFLSRRRFSAGTGASFTYATSKGVRELAALIGAPSTTSFDPSWLVWLPTNPYVVASTKLVLGFPAPPPGSTLFTSPSSLVSAVPISADTASNLNSNSQTAPTVSRDDILSIPTGDSIQVGSQALGLTTSRDALSPTGLSALSKLVSSNQTVVQAIEVRQATSNEFVVPTAAIVGGATQTCVEIESTHGDAKPVRIRVVEDDQGQTIVTGRLSLSKRVLVSPTGRNRSCD